MGHGERGLGLAPQPHVGQAHEVARVGVLLVEDVELDHVVPGGGADVPAGPRARQAGVIEGQIWLKVYLLILGWCL